MALRLPTQLATPGKFHHLHHHSKASVSWKRTIAPDAAHFSPLSSSTSTGRCNVGPRVMCTAETVGVVNLAPGTPVRPTSILVVGATGTLGRQVVRRALDEGYEVRCLVRPRPAPADFLRDWGAIVVNADLSKPETIPATLVGIHTIIDCATGRPEEPIRKVDWEGKVALIQCAKAMGIQKYVFFSIHNCDKHPEVPLMEIKYCTEKFLQDSGLNHIIIRLCGFMQVITLCERLAGQDANVTIVPVSVLRLTRQVTLFFEWTNDVADRLTFAEVLTSDIVFSVPMNET